MSKLHILKLAKRAVNELQQRHQAFAVNLIEEALIHDPRSIDLVSLKVDIVTNLLMDAHDDLSILDHDWNYKDDVNNV